MKGPSMTIDTEAAASLSAVFIACDGTLDKGKGVKNDFALAGGVYFNLAPMWWPQLQAAGLLDDRPLPDLGRVGRRALLR